MLIVVTFSLLLNFFLSVFTIFLSNTICTFQYFVREHACVCDRKLLFHTHTASRTAPPTNFSHATVSRLVDIYFNLAYSIPLGKYHAHTNIQQEQLFNSFEVSLFNFFCESQLNVYFLERRTTLPSRIKTSLASQLSTIQSHMHTSSPVVSCCCCLCVWWRSN